MKEIPSLLLDTAAEVVMRHLERNLRSGNISDETMAIRIHEAILKRTPERARVDRDFPLKPDPHHVMREGGQKLRRWRNPAVSASPAFNIYEAIVLSLDEPFRLQCCQELAQRLGGFFVPSPSLDAPELTSVADFLREVGEAVTSWAALAQDGINGRDDPAQLRAGIAEIDDVVGRALSMKQVLQTALADAESKGGKA